MAEIGVSPGFAVQPQFGYQRHVGGLEGDAQFEVNGLDGEADVEFTLISDLLRFPIYAKPKVAVGSGHLYGLAGPEFGFVIGDVRSELETVVEVPDADIRESDTETGSEVPDNRFLFGAGVGAGATTSL